MTFFSEASANSSAIARFKTRQPQTVTSSATATASSEISLNDAYQKAYELAQNIANSQSQHDVDILVQSVDTATIGENVFYLGSSLLEDYIREEDDNKTYTLLKDFTLPEGMNFHIQDGKILHILENAHLTINNNNEMHIFGTLYCNGSILVNGGKLVNHSKNTLILNGNATTPIAINNSVLTVTNGTLVNTDGGTMLVTNYGQISLSDSSTFTNGENCSCTIENSSRISADNSYILNNGLIIISDVNNTSPTPTGLQTSTIASNYIFTNNGSINIGSGSLGFESSYNANSTLLIAGTITNNGTINISYNNSNQILDYTQDEYPLYATNSISIQNITNINNPNSGNGVINDYVSSDGNNVNSESGSINFSVFNNTPINNSFSQTNIPVNSSDFPGWITVISN